MAKHHQLLRVAGLPLFAKKNGSAGNTKASVEKVIVPVIGQWKNGPRIKVVQSVSDLPGGTAPHDVEGAYAGNGVVYLVADNLPTEQRILEVLSHEAVGHAAMESMLGADLMAELTKEIGAWERRGSKLFVELGQAVDSSQPNIKDQPTRRAKEIVALMAERGLHKQGSLWKKVTEAIKAWLRGQGFSGKWVASLPEDMVFQMLRDAERYLKNGNGGPGGPRGSRKNVQASLAYSRRGNFGSDRTAWPEDFPPVVFAAQLGAAQKHADYEAAKAGDWEAAGRLVQDIASDARVESIRQALAGRKPIIVPVVAEESTGANKIPRLYAEFLASKQGLDTGVGIVQSYKANRTGKGSDHRLAVQPTFDGQVERDREYLIVDDTMTMGGTLANLRGHIEANGGTVILASSLSGFGDNGVLALTKAMRDAIWAKHGKPLDDYLREEFGDGVDQLTQGEAGHFRKAETLDAIRNRISEARRQVDLGEGEGILPSGEVTPGNPLFSRSSPSVVGDAISSLTGGNHQHDSEFHEELRRLREADKTAWSKAKNWWKRNFYAGGLLPEGVFDAKIQRDGAFNAIEHDVRHLTGTLSAMVKKEYGKDLNKLSEADKALMAEALAGKWPGDAVKLETRSTLLAMRKYIDSLSGEYTKYLADKVVARLAADPEMDPRLNFAKSATKMSRLIWSQRFLDLVREIGVGTFLVDADSKPAIVPSNTRHAPER